MKKLLLGLVVIGLLLVIGCGGKASSQENNIVSGDTVAIKDFSFSPEEISVKKGDTVTWINGDSAPHTIASDSGGELNSGTLNKDGVYQHTFNDARVYTYHCGLHPSMKGKVVVE